MKVKSLSLVRLLATPWTVAYPAPLSMGFSRQEYWSEVPLPSPGMTSRSIEKVMAHKLYELEMPEFLSQTVEEGIKRPKELGMLKWVHVMKPKDPLEHHVPEVYLENIPPT